MKYLHCKIDPQELMTVHELMEHFRLVGADGSAVFLLRERLRRQFGTDLIVQYPFGTNGYEGAFFIPLREGVACLRYNVVELERGEILSLDASELVEHGHVRSYLKATLKEGRRLTQAFLNMQRLLVGDGWGRGLQHRLRTVWEKWRAFQLPF